MPNQMQSQLDMLVEQVLESAKYRHIHPSAIRRIGDRELAIRRNLKDAIKETKNTLHQVAGAFTGPAPKYDACLQILGAAYREAVPHLIREACMQVMGRHASTRERLADIDEFYSTLFSEHLLGRPIQSILDVACGLNPVALPWMPVAPNAAYYACDLYSDMMAFLNGYFALAGVNGAAEAHDVIMSLPDCCVDVALLLKALPPIDQADRAAGLRLLRALRARIVIVSFPTRSLGGRSKSMEANYEHRFRDMIREEPWMVERFLIGSELCFRVTKPTAEANHPLSAHS